MFQVYAERFYYGVEKVGLSGLYDVVDWNILFEYCVLKHEQIIVYKSVKMAQ
jgi:hypothetical protein